MELFALYFNLLIYYIELSTGFWVTWILKKENPKLELFIPLADLAFDNISIYIYVCVCVYIYNCKNNGDIPIFAM